LAREELVVKAAIDSERYETSERITDEQMAEVNITPAKFHGE
jgi:hypothetical protein